MDLKNRINRVVEVYRYSGYTVERLEAGLSRNVLNVNGLGPDSGYNLKEGDIVAFDR